MAYDRLVMLDDIGRRFTFRAGRIVSGGFLVGFSSGTDIVGSGGVFGGLAFNDILIDAGSVSPTNFVGIALQTGSNGDPIPVAFEGVFVLPVGVDGTVGGDTVGIAGAGSNFIRSNGTNGSNYIGRALSAASANTGFAIVRLI